MSIFNTNEYTNILHNVANVATCLGNILGEFTPNAKAAGNIELGFINFLMQHLEAHRQTLLATATTPLTHVDPVHPVVAPVNEQSLTPPPIPT